MHACAGGRSHVACTTKPQWSDQPPTAQVLRLHGADIFHTKLFVYLLMAAVWVCICSFRRHMHAAQLTHSSPSSPTFIKSMVHMQLQIQSYLYSTCGCCSKISIAGVIYRHGRNRLPIYRTHNYVVL